MPPKKISESKLRRGGDDAGLRRIYKGDVPHIYDHDTDLNVKKATCSAFRFGRQNDPPPNPKEVVPTAVRRQSLDKEAAKKKVPPSEFPNNAVITSRYTMWNFLPKNLFEQFRRIVNFYFLVVAFIQAIIDSPVHPVTAVSPLAFVILVTAIKQGYEDWLRHKNDDQVNNRMVKVVRFGKLMEIKSKDIQVGDLVILESDEQVPTDMLVIGCSDEFLRCQINTANLDGETNLKLRYCPSGLPPFKAVDDLDHLNVIIECEQPNADLYEFSGSLLIPVEKMNDLPWSTPESASHMNKGSEGGGEGGDSSGGGARFSEQDSQLGKFRQGMTDFISIPISMDNMVLRGTRLKNTEYIFGIVVYTGKDTRLARNSEQTQAKFSTVEKAVNYYLVFFIFFLIVLVTASMLMHCLVSWYPGLERPDEPWYTEEFEASADYLAILNTIGAFTVLFNYIIPISLYVTIELQKFLGSKFFVWDQEMTDEEGREPLCNTSDLNEELGQIEYLFSDKTGTLTQNVMQFRYCSIDSVRYEYKVGADPLLRKADSTTSDFSSTTSGNQRHQSDKIFESEKVLMFFKTLALCHSVQVVPKRRPSFDYESPKRMSSTNFKLKHSNKLHQESEGGLGGGSLVTPEPSFGFQTQALAGMGAGVPLEFQASSPDEKALLISCERLGIVYRGQKNEVLTLDVLGKVEKYKRLMHLEFDADRKCMSVIVELPNGEKWLLTKGAESSIIPKCDNGPTQQTLKHVNEYALMGLRTLAVANRRVSNAEYEDFAVDLRAARRLIKNRQEKVREVYSSIENHLTLLGATGVEDQLQDYVPETLQALAAAGIHVWMLTGDKLETGVNVAISCGLITASTKQYIVDKHCKPDEICKRLQDIHDGMDESDNTCFVIDGDSLALCFKLCPEILRDASMKAYRVVCCRMAPLQKAQVVQMVKNSPKQPTCCAVGDGANDCAMILAAHVGIGILGKEGRQAARCADFALAKFGHLRKAILVHGHWYYVRLANLANYFFYKNVVFVTPQLFFSYYSNFSTQALFSGLFLMNYNIFFASCPIFYYGLLEQPYSRETLMDNPRLYRENRRNALMSVKRFIPWLVSAFWHSFVVFYVPYYAWDNFGEMDSVASFGTVVFAGIVVVSNAKMFIETKFVSWWYFGAQLYSYATFFLITSIHSEVDLRLLGVDAAEFHHVFFAMLSSVAFWFLIILLVALAIIPDAVVVAVQSAWEHSKERVRLQVRNRKSRDYMGMASTETLISKKT